MSLARLLGAALPLLAMLALAAVPVLIAIERRRNR